MINIISVKALLKKVDIDRTVFIGILTRSWQFIAGPISMLLIVSRFSRELQGYYYTFGSLLALQVFVEVGIGQVILQFASHEWSKLSFDEKGYVRGDPDAFSRLASLGRIAFSWYFIGGIILVIALSIGGYVFFSHSPSHGIFWTFPWFALCVVTGATFCIVPVWSLLSGCNQIQAVYFYRLVAGFLSSLTVWIAIASGAGLWTGSIYSLVVLTWGIIFIWRKYRHFFKIFLRRTEGPIIKWKEEILPFQWRIALSWLSGYLAFSLFTPVLFKFQGPIVAGQMGMTWTLVGVVGSIAGIWIDTKTPQFGILVAQKNWVTLDKLILRAGMMSMFICIAGAGLLEVFIIGINCFFKVLSLRFLPPLQIGIFLVATILMQSTIPLSSYLRAHKKEPFMGLSIGIGVLVAISTIIGGKYYSSLGVAWGYLAVNIIIVPYAFYVFFRCRKIWHIVIV
jgi:hypothetical protein